jgi:site-specific DNA-methyltransferase (adenine-specific)
MSARAPRNRTITLSPVEAGKYRRRLLQLAENAGVNDVLDRVFCQDMQSAALHLPDAVADLLFVDPPYNLTKDFNGRRFSKQPPGSYCEQLETWLSPIMHVLKPTASVYICSDWRASADVQMFARQHFKTWGESQLEELQRRHLVLLGFR